MDAGEGFNLMLGFLDTRGGTLPKISFQRDAMGGEFTLRAVVVELFQFLKPALLIEFKILPDDIFRDTDEFRNLRMGQPMRFQP